MKNHFYLIQMCTLIWFLSNAGISLSSLKNQINYGGVCTSISDSCRSPRVDTVKIAERQKSFFNAKIAIPVSLLSGMALAGIFMKIFEDDPPEPTFSVTGPGTGAVQGLVLGFAIGFTGSMAAFIIIAYQKSRKQEEKNRTSSLDFNIANHQIPVKSRIYFLNYRYHF